MPISPINLTPEYGVRESCFGCVRRDNGCHGTCTDYAADVILGVLGHAEHVANQQHKADLYHTDRDRSKRGLR